MIMDFYMDVLEQAFYSAPFHPTCYFDPVED